jgi:hypothetical protein
LGTLDGFELIYQGEILSVTAVEEGFLVEVRIMPYCTICRKHTFSCPHLRKESAASYFFNMPERPSGKNFKYYAERSAHPKGEYKIIVE